MHEDELASAPSFTRALLLLGTVLLLALVAIYGVETKVVDLLRG